MGSVARSFAKAMELSGRPSQKESQHLAEYLGHLGKDPNWQRSPSGPGATPRLAHQRVGQGVYGLRRAFLLAGAETVVTSLWNEAETETAELV